MQLFLFGVNAVVVVNIKPKLMAIIYYLTPALLKRLFHVTAGSGINIGPEA